MRTEAFIEAVLQMDLVRSNQGTEANFTARTSCCFITDFFLAIRTSFKVELLIFPVWIANYIVISGFLPAINRDIQHPGIRVDGVAELIRSWCRKEGFDITIYTIFLTFSQRINR